MDNVRKYLWIDEDDVLTTCYNGATEMVIPAGVTKIGEGAFEDCVSLKSVTIPDGVTVIEWLAFEGCTSLQSVTIPDSVTEISYNAFEGCTSLHEIIVGENNPNYISVNGVLYSKDKKELLCYPAGKGEGSFVIPDSVTEIGYSAFEGCTSLQSVTIPDSVTEIGHSAFEGCTSLQSVTIPDSVTEFGGPYLISGIGEYDDVFAGCASLCEISVGENNPYYTSINGVLYSKDRKKLLRCPEGRNENSFEIPDGVTEIKEEAFGGCLSIREIIASESNPSHTSINGVLYSKDKKELILYPAGKDGDSFEIPDCVTKISNSAFYECTSLKSIVIPNGVTAIGDRAFERCTSLQSITIPDSVKILSQNIFLHCVNLREFAYGGCTYVSSDDWFPYDALFYGYAPIDDDGIIY